MEKHIITDLQEIMARCYHQVLVGQRREDNLFIPECAGSAFLFAYRDKIFLISAEHVVSPSNEYFKLSPDKNYVGALYTNKIIKTPDNQIAAEMVSFNIDKDDFTTYYRWDNATKQMFVERVDMFYYPISENSQFAGKTFLTIGQEDSNGNIKYKGLQKIVVNEQCIAEPNKEHLYAIQGIVQLSSRGNQLVGKTVLHHSMSYISEVDGKYFLSISKQDEFIDTLKYWSGLSGAAVYDQTTGQIIGIATKYYEDELKLEVISMKQIRAILDGYLKSRLLNSSTFTTMP